jgi:hypothetical protein
VPFSPDYARTGDPTAEEAMATGGYAAQQWAGFRRLIASVLRTGATAKPARRSA